MLQSHKKNLHKDSLMVGNYIYIFNNHFNIKKPAPEKSLYIACLVFYSLQHIMFIAKDK